MSGNRGWIVTFAGTGINLALGVLYAWSVVAKQLTSQWGWSASDASLPYAVACGVFAVMMVLGGRLQDKIGPRIVASLGGAMTGLGLILASFASQGSLWLMVLGFGVLAGTGIGFGYASASPPALKWFPPSKKGMITGLVVSGFGLASVYIAPVTNSLLASVGISKTFLFLGIAFFIVTVLLSQFLVNPPAGYVPAGMPAQPASTAKAATSKKHDYDWHEMVKTPQFYLLWLMYAFASFAGLMIIGHLAKIAAAKSIDLGFVLVAVLAVGNAAGRIIAGIASDKLGRTKTMLLVFISQAAIMLLFNMFDSMVGMIFGAAAVGFMYGANLSLFPSTTADFFGTKNLGVNYGLVFTAWGVGGVFGSMVAGKIVDFTGTYAMAFVVAAVLLGVAAVLSFLTKAPQTIMINNPNFAGVQNESK